MDKPTQRAATIAANKLLAAAGYDPRGLSLQAGQRKALAKKRAKTGENRQRQKANKKRRRQAGKT